MRYPPRSRGRSPARLYSRTTLKEYRRCLLVCLLPGLKVGRWLPLGPSRTSFYGTWLDDERGRQYRPPDQRSSES